MVYFRHQKIYKYFGTLVSLFSSKPLQVGYYYSPQMAAWIKEKYKDYDVVFCSTIRTTEYVKNLDIKKCIDFIDAISLNYSQGEKKVKGFRKLIYLIENRRLLNYERKIVDIFKLGFITTKKDKDFILEKDNEKMVVLPNGVEERLLKRDFFGKEKKWLTFLGKMNYDPNEDACLFFAKKIFPEIKKRDPDIQFYIVGINPSKKILKL